VSVEGGSAGALRETRQTRFHKHRAVLIAQNAATAVTAAAQGCSTAKHRGLHFLEQGRL
jgi:hypothetical protein